MSGRAIARSDHVPARRPSRPVSIVAARKPRFVLQRNGAGIANGIFRPLQDRNRLMFVVGRVMLCGIRRLPCVNMISVGRQRCSIGPGAMRGSDSGGHQGNCQYQRQCGDNGRHPLPGISACPDPSHALPIVFVVLSPQGGYPRFMSEVHQHASHPAIVTRLKRAEGHLRHVIAMIEAGSSCPDIATQLLAVERAVGEAKRALIHDHIDHCPKSLRLHIPIHRQRQFLLQ